MALEWRSEGLFLSFYCADPRDQTQVIPLGSKLLNTEPPCSLGPVSRTGNTQSALCSLNPSTQPQLCSSSLLKARLSFTAVKMQNITLEPSVNSF